MQWIGFTVGLFLGTTVGLVVAALLRAAKETEYPDVYVDKAPERES